LCDPNDCPPLGCAIQKGGRLAKLLICPCLIANANAVHSRPADRGKLSCRCSSPLLRAPALRPARLLGCLASPRRLASGHHLASPPRLRTHASACTSQVLICMLGEHPTGGTHSASQTHLLRRCNCRLHDLHGPSRNHHPPCSAYSTVSTVAGAPRPLLPPPSPKSRFGAASSVQYTGSTTSLIGAV
jgi:hypothetical protein